MPKLFASFTIPNDGLNALGGNLLNGAGAIETSVEGVKTTLTSFAGDLLPYLVGVAGAFLVFWLLKLVIRIVKSFSK